jgi:hypothetical protein
MNEPCDCGHQHPRYRGLSGHILVPYHLVPPVPLWRVRAGITEDMDT